MLPAGWRFGTRDSARGPPISLDGPRTCARCRGDTAPRSSSWPGSIPAASTFDNNYSHLRRKRPPNAPKRPNVLSIQDGARCGPASPSRPAASGSPRSSKASRSTQASTSSANDREGLEKLCGYGARPPFALERLSVLPDRRVCYRLKHPIADRRTELLLAPTEFLLSSMAIPPAVAKAPTRIPWAELLERVFRIDVLRCERCGGRIMVLAFLTERASVKKVLEHLGLPTTGPPIARARTPVEFDFDS